MAILIACSHGTDNPLGRAEIHRLRALLAVKRPGLDVREAYVDVQWPQLPEVLGGLAAGVPAVVVPLLLSAGVHTGDDIAGEVNARESAGAQAGPTRAAAPLGPDPRLASLLARRLAEASAGDDDAVVLAAAGSTRPEAVAAVETVRADLARLRGGTVLAGYGAGSAPTVAEAVARLRASHDRVAVASYLLAPGLFHDRLQAAGADVVTAPLLPDEAVADIILDRFDAVR